MKILKSIGSVLAGFITVAVLSIATDAVFEGLGIFPPQMNPHAYVPWMLAVALFYRSIATIIGGYVTARLAPSSPIKHIYGLMVLGGLGGLAGVFAGWQYGNQWYPILLAITGPMFVWVGGKMQMRK